ncbi:dihydrodipicolinate synthase family protein [Sphingomonas sp. HITSZ_GF]|uniref:dihydrodipicolinate synthase family protein n=1 Tax=Sphingomonas sp. HITSZ_GF TaxID=3037247 RepID=UPI00240D4BB9|nr:dihydrodipicolinate synthase family protein [Sphingomonas sp. HITSZ_GF]MDG2534233.1 dihydrodipicolinate synthase family protein [Sphingomonas sp. HITSZ_GF]
MPIAGAFPVLPTIFDERGAIDEGGLRRVIEWAIACGVDGLVFPGLASEYDQLSLDERLHLIGVVGELTRDRVAFVAGCGGQSDAESAALIQAAGKAGAAAAMVVTPARHGDDPEALIGFYRMLGDAADVPVMLQNAPKPMGLGLSPEQILKLAAAAPAIRYVKEENQPCGQRITALLSAGADLDGVFGGAGGRYITDELARGATGTMPASELTDLHTRMIAAHRLGDWATVRTLFERMLPLLNFQAVFRWRLTKEVLRRRGLIASAYTRAPGPALDRWDLQELDEILAALEDLTGPLGAATLAA